MPNFKLAELRGLLAVALMSCTGCAAHWCHLPDDCAHAFCQTQLGWEINDVLNCCPADCCVCGACCDDCGCGVHVYDDAVWLDEARPRRPRIAVGPPPEPYKPPMPPKFLPVPARPVFSPVNVHAPTLDAGQVEVGFGPQLASPAGD